MGINLLDYHVTYALAFVVFMGLLYIYAWPWLRHKLDEYVLNIQHRINEASRYREDALAFLNSCKRKHMEASIKAEKILDKAAQQVEQMKSNFEQDLKLFEEQQRKITEERIQKLEVSVSQDIQQQLINLAFEKVKQDLVSKEVS